jgi:hypothetical protein
LGQRRLHDGEAGIAPREGVEVRYANALALSGVVPRLPIAHSLRVVLAVSLHADLAYRLQTISAANLASDLSRRGSCLTDPEHLSWETCDVRRDTFPHTTCIYGIPHQLLRWGNLDYTGQLTGLSTAIVAM